MDLSHKGATEIFDLNKEMLPFVHDPETYSTEKYDTQLRETFYHKVNELLGEMSLGLMPSLVEKMVETIQTIHNAGTTVLLVEQMVQEALEVAQRDYVIQTKKIVISGSSKELLNSHEVRKAYMGM